MTVRRTKLTPERYDLGPVWLYREDLQAIADAVNEIGDLKITCFSGNESFEASESSDFIRIPETLEEVTISSGPISDRTKMVTVNLHANAWVELTEPNIQSAGVLSRIRDICEQRKRTFWAFRRWFGPALAIFGVICFATVSVISIPTTKSPVWNSVFLTWVVPLTELGLIVSGIGIRLSARSREVVITNAPRASRPRYWQRTRDMWVVGIITTIVGVLLGYVLGRLG